MAKLPLSRNELESAVNAGQRFKYVFFWGHRKAQSGAVTSSCFSQWYEAPFEVEGDRYGSAEHCCAAEPLEPQPANLRAAFFS